MENIITSNPDEYIKITVESTSNIQDWIPFLIELTMLDSTTVVYFPLTFDDDYTDLLTETVDKSDYCIEIMITVQQFNESLNFLAERTRQGDIISVWKSVDELNNLIDELSETDVEKLPKKDQENECEIWNLSIEMKEKNDEIEFNAERQLRKDQMINRINSLSSEEYALELVEFIKKELAVKGRVWVPNVSRLFWENQKIEKWMCPTEIEIKISKIEGLAQEIFDTEQKKKNKKSQKFSS